MIGTARHDLISTAASAGVQNSQIPGIGRLESVADLVLINNLGRNIQFCSKNLDQLALFAETIFPDQDEESQFDLDFHAFLELEGKVLAINHYGLIRLFNHPGKDGHFVQPIATKKWPGDVERFAVAEGCLFSTSPQGYSVQDPAQPGILISAKAMPHFSTKLQGKAELPYEIKLQDWGMTTAIAVLERQRLVAIAAKNRIGIYSYELQNEQLSLGARPLVEFEPRFVACMLKFDKDGRLFAAGYDQPHTDANDQAWDALAGGGFCLIEQGSVRYQHSFEIDLAWGNGSDPVLLDLAIDTVYGIDKFAGLHSWNLVTGEHNLHCAAEEKQLLGMAHATIVDGTILCGFNRDNYRIHRYRT